MRVCWLLFFVVIICLATPKPAQAYLDPASGSLILQFVLGGIAGLAMLLKLYWHKVKSFLGLSKKRPEAE